MKHCSRRKLLVAAGVGTSLTPLSAGCLDQSSETDVDNTDESDGADETSTDDLTLLERWVPASGSDELLFHYRDLTAIRQYEDDLQSSVVEEVPMMPKGDDTEIVERLASDEQAVDAVCRFGSKGAAGNVVVSGSFDPDTVDETLEPAAGEFEVLERESGSVAVSTDTVVVSQSDGAALEAILGAGVEGTDRRVDVQENFGRLLDHVGESTFLWGEYETGETDGVGAAFLWSLGSETTTFSGVKVHTDSSQTDGFEAEMTDRFDDITVEVDGNVGVATKTVPTEEYVYRDLFAERGSEPPRPQAGVSFDDDSSARTVTVTYISSHGADRLEIRDENGNSDELTTVGEATTFDYETGATGTVTVIAASDGSETVVATYQYSF